MQTELARSAVLCGLLLAAWVTHGADRAQPSPASAVGEGDVSVSEVEPVVIEGEPLGPTREEMHRRMRDKLVAPPTFLDSERRLGSGVVEVTTSVGRLCVPPPPDQVQSGLGGSVTLATPCASF